MKSRVWYRIGSPPPARSNNDALQFRLADKRPEKNPSTPAGFKSANVGSQEEHITP